MAENAERGRGGNRAWERAKRFFSELAKLNVKNSSRGWTREEAYEDRLGRYGPPLDRFAAGATHEGRKGGRPAKN